MPLYSSLRAEAPPGASPPSINPAVVVPCVPEKFLVEFISFISVQVEPFHCSTAVPAPTPIAAVAVPKPLLLLAFKLLSSVHELPS